MESYTTWLREKELDQTANKNPTELSKQTLRMVYYLMFQTFQQHRSPYLKVCSFAIGGTKIVDEKTRLTYSTKLSGLHQEELTSLETSSLEALTLGQYAHQKCLN